jgi:hypothetical protein
MQFILCQSLFRLHLYGWIFKEAFLALIYEVVCQSFGLLNGLFLFDFKFVYVIGDMLVLHKVINELCVLLFGPLLLFLERFLVAFGV